MDAMNSFSQPSRNAETSSSSASPSPHHTYLSFRKEACEGLRLLYESSVASAEYSPVLDPLTAAFGGGEEGNNFSMNCLPFADQSLATLVDLLKCGQTQEYSEHSDDDAVGAALSELWPKMGSEVHIMVAPDNDGKSKGHGHIEGKLGNMKDSEQQSGTADCPSADPCTVVSCQRLLRLSAMSRLAHILQQRYINASLVVTERNINTLGEALGLVIEGGDEKNEEVKAKHINNGIKSNSLNISCLPSRQKPMTTSESDNDNAGSNTNAATMPPRTTVHSFSDGAGDNLAISCGAAENTTQKNNNKRNFDQSTTASSDHDAARHFLLKMFRQCKHAERRASSINQTHQKSSALSSPTFCPSGPRDHHHPPAENSDAPDTHGALLLEKFSSYAHIAHRIAIRFALLKDDSQTVAKRYRLAITRLNEARGGGRESGGDFGGGLSCHDVAAVFNFSDSESESDDDEDDDVENDVNTTTASMPQTVTETTETRKRAQKRDPHGELSVYQELHARGPAPFHNASPSSAAIPTITTTTAPHNWYFTSLLPHIIRILDQTTRVVLPHMERDLREFCAHEGSINLMNNDDDADADSDHNDNRWESATKTPHHHYHRVNRSGEGASSVWLPITSQTASHFSYEDHFSVVSASVRILYDARSFDYELPVVRDHIVRLHAAYGRFLGLLEGTEKLLLHTTNTAHIAGAMADTHKPLQTVSTLTKLRQTPFNNTAPLTLLNTCRTRAFVGTNNKKRTKRAPPQGEGERVPFADVMRGAPPVHLHCASVSSFCGYGEHEEGPVSMAASRLRELELIPNEGVGGTHCNEGLPALISLHTTTAMPPQPSGAEQRIFKAPPPPRMRFSYTDASGLVFPYESPCAVWLSQFLPIAELEDAIQLLSSSI